MPLPRRVVFYLAVLGVVLMFFCAFLMVVGTASAKSGSEQAPYNHTARAITRDISQGGTVYWGETIDMRRFTAGNDFMPGIVYNENDPERLIDINGYTVKIFIDPEFWPVGEYHLWFEEDEPNANTLAFFVAATKITPPVNETSVNFTGINESAVIPVKMPLEDRRVADIVSARGDPLYYENPLITNTSKVWIFGPVYGLYNVSCGNGSVMIDADTMSVLRPGSGTLLIVSPGKNTIVEAWVDNKSETIRSPFYWVKPVDIKGMAASVVYDKFVAWVAENTDDELTALSFSYEEPMIEITRLDRQHFALESMRVAGYTNLMNNSVINVSVDDGYFKEGARYSVRFETNATSYHAGELRQFDISVPFDEDNMTAGWHDIVARGNYGAYARTQYTVYELPAEREEPDQTFKVIGGNIFIPTPTPITVLNETVKTVERVRTEVKTEIVKEPFDYQKFISTGAEMVLPYAFLGLVIIYLLRVSAKSLARGRERM